MNYKRKRSKEARAGCLICKPWKFMGNRVGAKNVQGLRCDEFIKTQIDYFKS